MKAFLGIGLAVSALLLALGAAPAPAGVIRHGDFTATIDPDGSVTGSGSGWNDGQWVYYSSTGWYNQWYYNDPPSWESEKWIDCHVELTCDGQSNIIQVALNWSTMAYNVSGHDVHPPMDDQTNPPWIERREIFTGQVNGSETLDIYQEIDDFNPEWVSIDIRQVDYIGKGPVFVMGTIDHQCVGVPEPSTLLMLPVLGLAALILMFARRFR